MRALFSVIAATATMFAAAPLAAQTTAITGGKVVVGDGSAPIEDATVVVRDGRIIAVGKNVTIPADARRVDAGGRWVTPGIVAGFSRLGLVEISAVSQTNDSSSGSSPFSAAINVVPAINPQATPIAVNRAAGITRALVVPSNGRNIFAGSGALIDLGEDYDSITRSGVLQYVEMGESGAARAGGSRAALHVMFRAMLDEAKRYASDPADYEPELEAVTVADAKALGDVISGRTRLLVHVERAADILQVLALKKEYPNLKLVLAGVSEGWRVADQIAAAKVPVIASALNDLPDAFERLAATQSNIGRMANAGVVVSIGMVNDRDAHQLRYATQYAGNLVALQKLPGAAGLTWDQAFAAITSGPAAAMGLDDQIGSLKAGRLADIVIWDGDPLELSSTPLRVMIDGIEQSLDNRQQRLRDRYRQPNEGALPKAYE